MPKSHLPAVIEHKIFRIRGQSVMLDADLAKLYGVPTHRLNEQVRRNVKRFPPDFCFTLIDQEVEILISQFAISRSGHGGRRKPISAFTEQGIAMLSSVLHSDKAIEVNIQIMRAFVQLRQWMLTHKEFSERLATLENHAANQGADIQAIFETIRQMMLTPATLEKKIGFGRE